MARPKISKLIRKIIKGTHRQWVFHCIGNDIQYEADDYMNLFATQVAEECLTLFGNNEKVTGAEIKDRIGKHFGFI